MKPLVVIESPYAARKGAEFPSVERAGNIAYARQAVRDSVLRGEAPAASHLLLTQPGILDDAIPEQRELGIEAGLAWLEVASFQAVYVDRGISTGMLLGIGRAFDIGISVIARSVELGVVPAAEGPNTWKKSKGRPVEERHDLAPGGDLAHAIGCRCPESDNHYGRRPRFVAEDCYLHHGRDYSAFVNDA